MESNIKAKDKIIRIWRSRDSGKTFTKLSNVTVADDIGFGKAADWQSYMALYMEGKTDGVRGFFRSDDAGVTWIRINDDTHQFGLDGVIHFVILE